MLNTQTIKKDFPIFKNNPDLTYLDSTATSLKPQAVINKLTEYYEKYSANIFRGIYKISEKATDEYEKTREIVSQFIKAYSPNEIIFTRNTTESLNLVAYGFGRARVLQGDSIVTSIMEHHSNFVQWQVLAFENGADFKVIDITDEGYLIDLKYWDQIITRNTKILALTYISNVLGTINPLKKIINYAKKLNPDLIVIVDAAQAAPHIPINVQDLGCDFLAFSGHKMLGPTGVGVLWGRLKYLEEMYPFQYGGDMIDEVTVEKTTFQHSPHKFEAGTPDIASVISFKEAIYYLQKIGWDKIIEHEKEISKYAIDSLTDTFGNKIKILGPDNVNDRGGIVAFTLKDFHPHDIAQILDEDNIAVRAGYHCAMPVHKRLDISATTRASFYIYNNKTDVDKLIEGLKKVTHILK